MESIKGRLFYVDELYIENFKKLAMTRHLGDNMPSVLIAIALFGLTVYFLTSRKRRNTPPAIRGRLPILGNILQFRGAQPFYILTKWAEKYGPIYTLRIGAINAVVLTSGDLAKEALVTKYGSFPSKHMTTALTIATQDKKMLPTLDYGPHYNALKRHMVTHLLGPIPQKENRLLRHELIIRMINGMFEDMPSEGRVVNMSAIVNNLLFELALRQVLGFAPKEMYVAELGFLNREQIYKILVQDLLELGLQFDWRNYWPMLSWVPNKKKENIWNETARRRDLVCEELWKMYKKQFALTGPTGCYADNINEDDETFKIKENLIPMIIWELVLESVDTVSVASEWIIYELARNPQVQERLYQEIKSVAGDRMVNEDDMRNLPYLDAIIKETLRVYNPVPVLIPRIPAEDITLGGYDIPKGWDVIVNQWGIGRDKTRWPDADVWDPERCLRDSSIDLGIKDFKITPFGGGKRMCPGIQQGVSMISLEVCGIVQHFEFSFPPNEGNTDAEISMVTFTTRKATPMLAYIKARVKNILPA